MLKRMSLSSRNLRSSSRVEIISVTSRPAIPKKIEQYRNGLI
jgi:hypothetical protein